MVEFVAHLQEDPASLFSRAMCSLTRREQTLVAFVLLTFCAGLGVKHWRDGRALASLQASMQTPR
jgi:hypothetical protein